MPYKKNLDLSELKKSITVISAQNDHVQRFMEALENGAAGKCIANDASAVPGADLTELNTPDFYRKSWRRIVADDTVSDASKYELLHYLSQDSKISTFEKSDIGLQLAKYRMKIEMAGPLDPVEKALHEQRKNSVYGDESDIRKSRDNQLNKQQMDTLRKNHEMFQEFQKIDRPDANGFTKAMEWSNKKNELIDKLKKARTGLEIQDLLRKLDEL